MFSWRGVCKLLSLSLIAAHCYGQVTINEIMAESKTTVLFDGSLSDWVELYNSSSQPVPLGGWSLTDSAANIRKWTIPNVTLPAGGYLVIALDSSRSPSSAPGGLLNAGFAIKGTGDNVLLFNPQGTLVDSVRFGPQATDYTIGALPGGSRNFVLTQPTPGLPNTAQTLGAASALRINEWMAAPSSGKDWFELFNRGALPVELSGGYFVDSGNEPSRIAPLSFIGAGAEGYLRFNADNSTNDNEVNFKLGASGDTIALYAANGSPIDQVVFGQQTTDKSQGRLPDGADNIQALNLATPAHSNLVLYDGLWVNEILTHTDEPYEDAVEFYNNTAAEIDLSGWYLSNSRGDLKKYRIPPGTKIPAQRYLVIYEYQFDTGDNPQSFRFNSAHGDRVILSQATASGDLTGSIVEQEFESAERNLSFGRVTTSAGTQFVTLQTPTFGVNNPTSIPQFRTGPGAPNAAPRVGPIVISEIMFNPSTNSASSDAGNDPDEYIKLSNITATPIPLYDPVHPTNVWKVARGVTYEFPRFSSVAANSSVLLVSFDPQVNTAQAAAFRAKYSVPAAAVLFGPFAGKLDNGGEAIALYRPDEPQGPPHPDEGYVPYVLVDRIDYSDRAPWPADADGSGKSLQRLSANSFGNDPANWKADAPAAGQGTTPAPSEIRIASIQHTGTALSISLEATPGRSYSLIVSSDLSGGAIWRTQSTTTAGGNSVTFTDEIVPGGHKFYRVVSP